MFGKLLYYFHGYKKLNFLMFFYLKVQTLLIHFCATYVFSTLNFLEFTKAYEDIVSKLNAKSTSDVLLMWVP